MNKLLICFFLIFGRVAQGQIVYQDGYIISNEGDTLRGAIGVRNWNRTFNYFHFRQGERPTLLLSPLAASKIVIPGWDTYQRLTMGQYIFFTKLLVSSPKISLYADLTEDGQMYINDPDNSGRWLALETHNFLGADGYISDYPAYMITLEKIANADSLNSKAAKAVLRRVYKRSGDMETMVMEINRALGYPSCIAYRKRRPLINIIVGAGPAVYSVKMTGSHNVAGHLEFLNSRVTVFDLGMESRSPWWMPRLAITAGMGYFEGSILGNGTAPPFQSYDRTIYSCRQVVVNGSAGVNYTLVKPWRDNFEIRAGLRGGFFVNTRSRRHLFLYSGPTHNVEGEDSLGQDTNGFFGEARAGILVPRLHLELTGYRQFPSEIIGSNEYSFTQALWGASLSYHTTVSK